MSQGLVVSNPVLVLDRLLPPSPGRSEWLVANGELDEVVAALLAEGVPLPPSAVRRWRESGRLSPHIGVDNNFRPQSRGVIGLVVDPVHGEGYVVPLVAERAGAWRIDPPLPPRLEALLELLRDICAAANATDRMAVDAHVFPEAFGVALGTEFPLASDGSSMDVALLLAVLGALSPWPRAQLRAACAVVERVGGRLVAVGGSHEKLDAFRREVDRGSLLVHAPGDEAAMAASPSFDEVWVVESVGELAQRLLAGGMLEPFAEPTPVDVPLGESLLQQLHRLAEHDQQHRQVVTAAERLLRAAWQPQVPARLRLAAMRYLPASLRHLGCYGEALARARDWQSHVDGSDLFAVEDQANAALEVAASLFDPGREREAIQVLAPWLDRIDLEPRLLQARTRVRLWNTAGRALAQLGELGWDAWFARSVAVQVQDDPAGVARTTNYRIAGCLRTGELQRAEELLAGDAEPWDPWRAFYRADLARRRGRVFGDATLEGADLPPDRVAHAVGFYWLATARQPRPKDDAARRFDRAAEVFRLDLAGREQGNVLWILLHASHFAAACCRGDELAATRSARALRDSVTQPGLEDLHAKVAHCLPRDGRSSPEAFFTVLPWL
jgi:hypothetical protein